MKRRTQFNANASSVRVFSQQPLHTYLLTYIPTYVHARVVIRSLTDAHKTDKYAEFRRTSKWAERVAGLSVVCVRFISESGNLSDRLRIFIDA